MDAADFYTILLLAGGQFYVMHDSEDDQYALASRGKDAVRRVITTPEHEANVLNVALFRAAFDPRIVQTTQTQLAAIVGEPFTIGSLMLGGTEIRAARCGDQAAASRLWAAGEAP